MRFDIKDCKTDMRYYSRYSRSTEPLVLFFLAVTMILGITLLLPRSASAAPLTQAESLQNQAEQMLSATTLDLSGEVMQAAFTGCAGPIVEPVDAAKEQRVVELTNIERANVGLPPLKLNTSLSLAARYHTADMFQDDYFQHATFDRNDGILVQVCEWHERVWAYVPDGGSIAENLAAGYLTPEEVVQAWMQSEGHRQNILGDYSELGAGYYNDRWGQDFARRTDTAPVIINGEAGATDSTDVTIYAYGDWQTVRLRNDSGAWSNWRTFSNRIDWQINAISGTRTLELELNDGVRSIVSSDTIEYTGPIQPSPTPDLNVRVYMPLVSGN